jgi:uncharacterized membrane protein YkoI
MKRLFVSLTWNVMLAIVFTTTAFALQESTREEKVKMSQLPAAVAQAIKSNCPGCGIDKATREVENGVTVYDIEFKSGKGEIALAEDGSVIDRETAVSLKDVPPAALEAIRKGASGAKVKHVAKGEVHAELKDGQIIKLSSPRYVYEAELQKDKQFAEIEVTSDGQVIEAPKWKTRGTKQN